MIDFDSIFDKITEGNIDFIMDLLEKSPDILNKKEPEHKHTLLHIACYEGEYEITEFLISRGADLNARCCDEVYPLYCAAMNGHVDIIKLLLEKGVDKDAITHCMQTALHVASAMGKTEAVKLLLDNEFDSKAVEWEGMIPLHLAVIENRKETVSLLLDRGTPVNIRSEKAGYSPLHYCARFGRPEMAELLISRGIDTQIKDNKGMTALQIAKERVNEARDSFEDEKRYEKRLAGCKETIRILERV